MPSRLVAPPGAGPAATAANAAPIASERTAIFVVINTTQQLEDTATVVPHCHHVAMALYFCCNLFVRKLYGRRAPGSGALVDHRFQQGAFLSFIVKARKTLALYRRF